MARLRAREAVGPWGALLRRGPNHAPKHVMGTRPGPTGRVLALCLPLVTAADGPGPWGGCSARPARPRREEGTHTQSGLSWGPAVRPRASRPSLGLGLPPTQ